MAVLNMFKYQAIAGGFQIQNGTNAYTRPLYASHLRDDGSLRYLYYAGDQPDIAVSMAVAGKRTPKLGNLFLGIQGGKWFSKFEEITTRYLWGRMEYELRDSTVNGTIYLTYVRSTTFDGLLVKIDLPQQLTDRLIVAVGARSKNYLQFEPEQCLGTRVKCGNSEFTIECDQLAALHGLVSVPINFAAKDAMVYSCSPEELLNSESQEQPLVAGVSRGNQNRSIYLALTTDAPTLESVQSFVIEPEKIFQASITYFCQLAETVKINTPDPYLNSALPAQILALDAAWNCPTIMHGAVNWHTPHAGWRSTYGFTVCGWHDRVQLNAKQYMKAQTEQGRITDFPAWDKRYNMGEVLVDQLLYDCLWSGDLDFMKAGGYQFIANHLQHQDDYLQVPEMDLYENWLNAWNTDNKWHQGGAGIISSSYTWHAYHLMAELAILLGKEDDAQRYSNKAQRIRAAAEKYLWCQDKGVYGEYRDRFGLQRLHDAPDLSSIYTPIDLGLTDEFSAHQMLRYTEYAIENVENFSSGRILWSSNWQPPVYSSMGIYPGELINLLLAYYQAGKPEAAEELLRGILFALYNGDGPGSLSHMLNEDGTNLGHRDFTDVTSMFVRTIVEGLFGIRSNGVDGQISIRPMFPREWQTASIASPTCSVDYHWDGVNETIKLTSQGKYDYQLELLARKTKVQQVLVNGLEVNYSLRAAVGGTYLVINIPPNEEAVVQVVYGEGELPQLVFTPYGAPGSYQVLVDRGTITKVYDPQGILDQENSLFEGSACTVNLKRLGWHTFFVYLTIDDLGVWLPVDLEIREQLEIINEGLVKHQGNTYCRFAIRNNTQENQELRGTVTFADSQTTFKQGVHAGGQSDWILVEVKDEISLTPGSNLIKVEFEELGSISKALVNWELTTKANYQTINLDAYVNQDLAKLHLNTYQDQVDKFYWVADTPRTVLPNGRAWWEAGRGQNCQPVLDKLPQGGEILVSDIGVPFRIAKSETGNSLFTSLFDNFPEKVKIQLDVTGSKLYFLLAASTNHMQSQLENARLTVYFADGSYEVLPLINPENIDDWLSYQTQPYAKTGYIQDLGGNAHANILDLDFGEQRRITRIEFACLSNQVLAGLLGITLVQ